MNPPSTEERVAEESSVTERVSEVSLELFSPCPHILEQKISSPRCIERLDPIHRTRDCINNRHTGSLMARQQASTSHIVCTDPQRIYRLFWFQLQCPVCNFREVQGKL